MKNKKKFKSSKKKDNLELGKEMYVSNSNNIEKNVINLIKKNDNSSK